MIVSEGLPMSRLLLALCLIAVLGGCHRKKAHAPASPAKTDSSPSLGVKCSEITFSKFLKGTQFAVQGRGCRKLEASLWHITADQASNLTHYTFTSLPEFFEGNLWLVAQKGDPFGSKDLKSYALGESIPAGTKASTSANPAVLQGPYPDETEMSESGSHFDAASEHVVMARCMSKEWGGHPFGLGNLDALKKHAAETKDEIIAVTIRWEP
jgi:hypothetical protein